MVVDLNIGRFINVLQQYNYLKPRQNAYLHHCFDCQTIEVVDNQRSRSHLTDLILFFKSVVDKSLIISDSQQISSLKDALECFERVSIREINSFEQSYLQDIKEKIKEVFCSVVLKGATLGNVLSFLSPSDVAQAQLVSKNFRKSFCGNIKNYFKRITQIESSCYKSYLHLGSIDFSQMPFEVTDDLVSKVVVLPALRSLTIDSSTKITDASFIHLSKASNLTNLTLSYCLMINGIGLSQLAELRQLQRLSLYMCKNFYKTSMKEFFKFTTLKDLNLGGCYKIALDALKYLGRLSELEALTLTHCTRLTDHSLNYLVDKTKLAFLDLSECAFTNQGVYSLSGLGIRYLKFSESDFVDNITILNVVRGFTNLNTLVLESLPKITDETFIFLSGSFELRKLRLSSSNRISDRGFSYLSNLQKLNELYIDKCEHITPFGWMHVSKAENLSFLSIHNQTLSDDVFREVAKLKNLMYFEIESVSGFTHNGIDHLSKSRSLKTLLLREFFVTDSLVKSIAKISSLRSVTLSLKTPSQLTLVDQLLQVNPRLKVTIEESY